MGVGVIQAYAWGRERECVQTGIVRGGGCVGRLCSSICTSV